MRGACIQGRVMDETAKITYQEIITAHGDKFRVPEYIVRVDSDSMAGWQLRYGEWTDYEDHPTGAEHALQSAIREMTSRVEYRGK